VCFPLKCLGSTPPKINSPPFFALGFPLSQKENTFSPIRFCSIKLYLWFYDRPVNWRHGKDSQHVTLKWINKKKMKQQRLVETWNIPYWQSSFNWDLLKSKSKYSIKLSCEKRKTSFSGSLNEILQFIVVICKYCCNHVQFMLMRKLINNALTWCLTIELPTLTLSWLK